MKATKLTNLTRRNFAPLSVARVKNPNVPGIGYSNDGVLYDSLAVAAAAAMPGTTVMFAVPVGSGGKTLAQTNMRDSAKLENGDIFRIKTFGVILGFNTCSADAANVLDNCSVALRVGGRTYLEGKVSLFPGGRGGLLTFVANTGALEAATTLRTGFSNGTPDVRNMFVFRDPIEVQAGESIAVELKAETGFSLAAAAVGGTGLSLTVAMDGERVRKVA